MGIKQGCYTKEVFTCFRFEQDLKELHILLQKH